MALSKYVGVLKIEFFNSFAYLYEFLANAGVIVVILFIFFNMWSTIYRASESSIVSGFTLVSLMWYIAISESVVSDSGQTRVGKKISDDVKSGDILYVLNKPYNFIIYNYAYYLGSAIFSVFTAILIGSIVMLFLVGIPPISPVVLPFIVITIILSITLEFLAYFSIGILSFWLEDVSAFLWIYQKLVFILGGMLIPLEFFPKFLQDVAFSLPFSYIAYAPAKLFVNFSTNLFLHIFLMQLLWIGAFAILSFSLYNKMARRVSINGG